MQKLTDEDMEKAAKEECSFPKKFYPNDIMEKQCQIAFIEGAKWAIKHKEVVKCQNQ